MKFRHTVAPAGGQIIGPIQAPVGKSSWKLGFTMAYELGLKIMEHGRTGPGHFAL